VRRTGHKSRNNGACVFNEVRRVVEFIQHGQYSTTISSLLIISVDSDIVKSVSTRSRILHHFYWLGKRSGNLQVKTNLHLGGTDASVDVAVTKLTFYVTAAASESEYDGNRSSWPGPLPTM
jgi:hypothetical protein